MAQPLALALHVPETTGDEDSLEASPYEENEVHDSFHQLIQEQSLRVAEEGLELLSLVPGRGDQTLRGLEGAPAHSTATLRILASMPSRTIGRSRGAIISQYYNRTVRLRRRSSRPLLGNVVRSARPSLRLYDLELDSTILEEDGELTNPVCWLGRSRTDCNRVTSLYLLSDSWQRSFPGLVLRPHPPPPPNLWRSAEEVCSGWWWSVTPVRALGVLLAGGRQTGAEQMGEQEPGAQTEAQTLSPGRFPGESDQSGGDRYHCPQAETNLASFKANVEEAWGQRQAHG